MALAGVSLTAGFLRADEHMLVYAATPAAALGIFVGALIAPRPAGVAVDRRRRLGRPSAAFRRRLSVIFGLVAGDGGGCRADPESPVLASRGVTVDVREEPTTADRGDLFGICSSLGNRPGAIGFPRVPGYVARGVCSTGLVPVARSISRRRRARP